MRLLALGAAAAAVSGCAPEQPASSGDPAALDPAAPAPNAAPQILGLSLSPSAVQTDGLVAASVAVRDPDGDAVTLSYRWFVDGREVGARGGLLDGASWFDKGQVITVEVTPSDGALRGAPASAGPVPVLNSPPGAPVVGLPEAPVAGVHDLVCAVLEPAEDPDGDTLRYRVGWWLDGAPYAGAVDGVWPGDTVPASEVKPYTEWRCRVTPSDGEAEGPAAEAWVTPALDYPGWSEQAVSLDTIADTLVGDRDYDQLGFAVAGAGDVDGDGLDDVLVGAPDSDAGAEDGGAALLVTAAALAAGEAGWTLYGSADGQHAGTSVAGAGDVDGDGLADVLIGAPGAGDVEEGAYLVRGADRGEWAAGAALDAAALGVFLAGETAEDRAGIAVAGAGDVDGDGLADVIVGADWCDGAGHKSGRTYLMTGAQLAGLAPGEALSLADADHAWTGEAASQWSGAAVAGVGDVDGDGLDDVLIGAPFNGDAAFSAGKSYLVLGASLRGWRGLASADRVFLGEAAEDNSGEVLAGAGDLDGDGRADLLIGARDHDGGGTSAGAVYLVLADSLDEPDLGRHPALLGQAENDRSGLAAGLGDLDGDGLGELLVGVPNRDSYRGGAALVFGAALDYGGRAQSLALAEYLFTGGAPGDFAGQALAPAGDVSGDGRPDLLIGAPGSANSAGRVYLIATP